MSYINLVALRLFTLAIKIFSYIALGGFAYAVYLVFRNFV